MFFAHPFSHPHILPKDKWDDNDNLVSPCPLEEQVLRAVISVQHSIRTFSSFYGVCPSEIDDKVYTVLISDMIMTRLEFNNVYTPNIAAISHNLCSICKEMMRYDEYAVQKFAGHYIINGTRGLDDLMEFTIDDCEKFFLFFMDIKSAVNLDWYWIVTEGHARPARPPQEASSSSSSSSSSAGSYTPHSSNSSLICSSSYSLTGLTETLPTNCIQFQRSCGDIDSYISLASA